MPEFLLWIDFVFYISAAWLVLLLMLFPDGRGQEDFRHEFKDHPKNLFRQYFSTSPTVTYGVVGNLPQKERGIVLTWLVGRGSTVGCGRRELFLPSALCSMSHSLCWLVNSLSSQHPPQTGAQLRSGNYTYLWLSEMPVLIIIKKYQVSKRKQETVKDRCIFPLKYSKC